MQGVMSSAEVGLIPRAERATGGFDQRMVRSESLRASAAGSKGSACCGTGHGGGQRFGGATHFLSARPRVLGTRGIAERPRVSGLGHCVDEETEPRKREEPHLGVTQRAWGSTI